MTDLRSYSNLIKFDTFQDRLEYLRFYGFVGVDTFGHDRYLNQNFYRSKEWKQIRDYVIIRDNGCDLGLEGYELHDQVIIHHINPLSAEDIINQTDLLLNPEYLITTSLRTHNAIHYGNEVITHEPIMRLPNDTCPWKTRGN